MTTYDPQHPAYFDEADARTDLSRLFDVCNGCRACTDLCGVFPALFERLDRLAPRDAGLMTPDDQDAVAEACSQCTLCVVRCPYAPGRHEAAVDVPRALLRVAAARRTRGERSVRRRVSDWIASHADLVGAIATRVPRIVNRVTGARPGSPLRRVLAVLFDISSTAHVPRFAPVRFSTWFARRPKVRMADARGNVAVFPTCIVEYHAPSVGASLVKVFEHNGVHCELGTVRCCGAPMLHAGDVHGFTRVAVDNVTALAASVKRGNDVVVAQPSCTYVVRTAYPEYVGGPDARLVAERTFDPAEYLIRMHGNDRTTLDTSFPGGVATTIAYGASSHLRALCADGHARDLMKLTGAHVSVVEDESGGGEWGLRERNATAAIPLAQRLADRLRATGAGCFVGDCHVTNTEIAALTGCDVVHPMQVLARAYGVGEDDERLLAQGGHE
jgi:Fe-S oxidoreductase